MNDFLFRHVLVPVRTSTGTNWHFDARKLCYFRLSYGSGANWDFNSAKPSYARSACSNDESNAHNFIKQHIALHYFKVFP